VAAAYPFWSPDSKSIAFFAAGKLKRVGISGGTPEDICNVPNGRGGAWSQHHVIVFADAGAVLRRVPADGGQPVPLTERRTMPREFEHRWPRFLPDGEHFMFWTQTADANSTGVYIASLSAPQMRTRLVATNFRADYALTGNGRGGWLFWVRGSTLVAQKFDQSRFRTEGDPYAISEVIGTGALGFAHLSVSNAGVLVYSTSSVGKQQMELRNRNGELIAVAGRPGILYHPRFSGDGNQALLARVESGNSDLWLYEFARSVTRRVTFDPSFDNFQTWSPDGRQIAFSASRGGVRNIFIKDLTQSTRERRLTQSPNAQHPCDWSPDGRYLMYREVHPATGADLWVLRLAQSEPKPEPFLVTPFEESDGAFAGDGKWLAYTSNESGRPEVYVQPFPPTGAKWLISDRGGSHPRWRRDKPELFYVAADDRLMSLDVKSRAGKIEFATPRELFRTQTRLGISWYDYDAAADGSRFLLLHPAADAGPVIVLLNWQSVIGS
jgi:Tol biopolymer transport system component